jgi:hypothetical protein
MSTTPIGKGAAAASPTQAFTAPVTNENPLPGIMRKTGNSENEFYKRCRVRYQSFDMRDLADLAELERIETKALRGEGLYITDYKNYTFMDKMYYLVKYIEEDK